MTKIDIANQQSLSPQMRHSQSHLWTGAHATVSVLSTVLKFFMNILIFLVFFLILIHFKLLQILLFKLDLSTILMTNGIIK